MLLLAERRTDFSKAPHSGLIKKEESSQASFQIRHLRLYSFKDILQTKSAWLNSV